jgi:hypothetical protein
MLNPYISKGCNGRGKRIRTSGPCLPKVRRSAETRGFPRFYLDKVIERAVNLGGTGRDSRQFTPHSHRTQISAIFVPVQP